MMTDTHAGEAYRRARGDLCPGALRPWPADDRMLVRLRMVGGHLPVGVLVPDESPEVDR